MAAFLLDVIPFDSINNSNTAATRNMLVTQIKPGPVLLFRNTYSLTADLVDQFIPVLRASGYAGQIKPGIATCELKFRVEPQSGTRQVLNIVPVIGILNNPQDHLPNNRIASVIG